MTHALRRASARFRTAAFGLAVVGACVPGEVAGQTGCQFVEPTRSAQSTTIPGQGQIWYLGGPTFRCADGVRIRADTAVVYVEQNLTLLMGSVRFRDPERLLLSDQARYFTRVGRLQAEGNLVLRDTVRGSVIEDGEMVYLRKTAQREQEQITVITGVDHVRPKATLYMRSAPDSTVAEVPDSAGLAPPDSSVAEAPDSAGLAPPDSSVAEAPDSARPPTPDSAAVEVTPPVSDLPPPVRPTPAGDTAVRDTTQVPYQVEADNLFLQGDQYFLATGTVYIVRDSVYARADSAEYDQVAGRLLLQGSAHVESSSYELQGENINIAMAGGDMRSIRAQRRAQLDGSDLMLTAPVIHLFLTDGSLERLVAVPMRTDPETLEEPDELDRARPVAVAERFRLTADSLEVLAPNDVLQRIFATGQARGDSSSRDSLNVEALPAIARTDWLEGDTVIAYFVPTPPSDPDLPADTTRDAYELERLVAVGEARSLYRLLPSDSTSRPGIDVPAVHYVTGASITISMLDGEVDLMEVDGPTQGWHLEPQRRVAQNDSVPPDSVAVRPDTVPVPPDTMSSTGPGRGEARQGGDPRSPSGGNSGINDQALPAAAFRERGRERRSGR